MLLTLFSTIVGLITLVYLYFQWKFTYWSRKNIPFVKPSFPFGNIKDIVLLKKTIGEVYQDFYWKLKGSAAGGFYKFAEPILLLRDEELIKTVLVKEFNNFHDNDFQVSEKLDPLLAYNPFAATGDKWRQIRNLHSGSLTTAKLKGMVPLTTEVCQNLINYIEKRSSTSIEAKDLCATYATDNVATCAFGLQCNSLINPNEGFNTVTRRVFESDAKSGFVMMITFYIPALTNFARFIHKDVSDYFIKLIKNTINYRNTNKIQRDDFLQQMMKVLKENEKDMDPILITSQCFGMLIDGFFTTSIAMSFVLYELAMHPNVQEKLRKDIQSVGDKITDFDYEKIQSIAYLDMVVHETLRKHPPAQTMSKKCTKTTTLSMDGRDFKIEKGVSVAIPVYAIHMDEKFYPKPNEFIPERFSEEEKSRRDRYTYLAFGEGPRICLGMKFALQQMKLGICAILLNFKLTARDKGPIELDPNNLFFHSAKNGLWIIFNKLNS